MTTALEVNLDMTEGDATFVLSGDIDRDAGDAL